MFSKLSSALPFAGRGGASAPPAPRRRGAPAPPPAPHKSRRFHDASGAPQAGIKRGDTVTLDYRLIAVGAANPTKAETLTRQGLRRRTGPGGSSGRAIEQRRGGSGTRYHGTSIGHGDGRAGTE